MPLQYTDEQDGEDTKCSYTVEQAIEKVGFGLIQLKIYVICKMAVATDALEVMLLSLIGPVVQCEWQLSEGQVAFMSTTVFFGMAAFSPLMGLLADHYGRRTGLIFTTLWTAYFAVLTSVAPVYLWLLILRGLVGAGMAGIPQGYAMVAEYMPSKFRAKMIVFSEVFWVVGALLEILLAALVMPTLGWRWLFAISAIPVFLAGIGSFFIPESIRFLVAAGRRQEATSILGTLARVNKSCLPVGTLVKSPNLPRGSIRDLFSSEYIRITLLLWPLWFGSSFMYYGIVLASPLLLSEGDETVRDGCDSQCQIWTTDDYISLATTTSGEFVGLIASFLLIDKIGRRWTGRVMCLAATVCMFLMQLKVNRVLMTLFVFGARGSTLTIFNLLYIYTVEVYPTTMRALALGMCNFWCRLASMLTPFLAQVLLVYSVSITVNIYGAIGLLCSAIFFALPIETMGRPMMQSVAYSAEPGSEEKQTIVADSQ